MAKITKNFTTDEMKCPCCGECEMDGKFAENKGTMWFWI